MPEANSVLILSNPPSRYPRTSPAPAQKLTLLDCLCEIQRFCHYSRRTVQSLQELLGYNNVKTTMIYTHVRQ